MKSVFPKNKVKDTYTHYKKNKKNNKQSKNIKNFKKNNDNCHMYGLTNNKEDMNSKTDVNSKYLEKNLEENSKFNKTMKKDNQKKSTDLICNTTNDKTIKPNNSLSLIFKNQKITYNPFIIQNFYSEIENFIFSKQKNKENKINESENFLIKCKLI